MKKPKPKEDFWLTLGLIDLVAVIYPMSCYLQAESTEDQILAVLALCGVGLLLAIVDAVSIAVVSFQ